MFYEFSQNNSGGSFDVNDKLCHVMIIEADTEATVNWDKTVKLKLMNKRSNI
jgi:hypothetical protein